MDISTASPERFMTVSRLLKHTVYFPPLRVIQPRMLTALHRVLYHSLQLVQHKGLGDLVGLDDLGGDGVLCPVNVTSLVGHIFGVLRHIEVDRVFDHEVL